MSPPAFCATCCEVRADLARSATGHWLCPDCSPDIGERMPAAGDYARGYDVPPIAQRIGSIREAFAEGARRVNPKITTEPEGHYVGMQATPGFVRVVVGRTQNGRALDRRQALESLRGNSWFGELRYLGSDRRGYAFERPDVEAAAAERRRAGEFDVAAGLAALARGGR